MTPLVGGRERKSEGGRERELRARERERGTFKQLKGKWRTGVVIWYNRTSGGCSFVLGK